MATPDEQLLLCFRAFGAPETKPVDFNATIGGTLSDQARKLLKLATSQRDLMISGIGKEVGEVDPRNVIAATDAYLPSIVHITQSMEAFPDVKLELNNKLAFTWTSVLGSSKSAYQFEVLIFEICYVLLIKATGHFDNAKLLGRCTDDHAPEYAEASSELRIGAGVLEYISKELLPRWMNPPDKRPVEIINQVIDALSLSFQVMAQRLAIAKAISGGKQPTVLAKLLAGAADKYEVAGQRLQSLDKHYFVEVQPMIRDELGTMPTLLRGMAYKYMGINAHEKEQYGASVAYLKKAYGFIRGAVIGPNLDPIIRNALNAVMKQTGDLYTEYSDDNSSAYFDSVPSVDDLNLPDGAFLVKPTPFHLEARPPISFAQVSAVNGITEEARRMSLKAASKRLSKAASSGDSKALVAPKGVDKDFFANLPREIQLEIIAESQQSTPL